MKMEEMVPARRGRGTDGRSQRSSTTHAHGRIAMAEMGLGGGGGEGGAAMLTFGEKDVTLFKLADVGVGTEGGSRIVGANSF